MRTPPFRHWKAMPTSIESFCGSTPLAFIQRIVLGMVASSFSAGTWASEKLMVPRSLPRPAAISEAIEMSM